MEFMQTTSDKLDLNPFEAVTKSFLLTAGTQGDFNTLTAGWGGFGIMWGKRVLSVVVRPSRHTFAFMEKNELFTASFFAPEYADVLTFCGTHSGRDTDKCAHTGLTPVVLDGGVAFEQANLVFVCKKLYAQDIAADGFIGCKLSDFYPKGDVHRMYLGEIIKVYQK